MSNPIPYDGTTKLGYAIAALHNISPKNHNKIAQLVGGAKAALGITSKAKVLPYDVKLAIYRWHYERVNHPDSVETISQPESNNLVEIISQSNAAQVVETISQNESVETILQYGMNDLVRIAFYTISEDGRKRQVIALDGFYINALMQAAGIGKADVPKWVQHAVNNWPAFDPRLPITKQVKYLIIRELTRNLTPPIGEGGSSTPCRSRSY